MTELRTVLPFLRPYRNGFLLGFFFVIVSNLFGLAIPELLGMAIDAPARAGTSTRTLLLFAGLILGAAALSGVARYGMRQQLNGVSRRVEVDLRDAFVDHLLRLDATFFGRNRTGDLMSRASNDTAMVRQAIGPGVMYLVNTVAMTTFCLVRMLTISPRLTLITLLPLMLLPPVVLRFGRVIHDRSEQIQEQLGVLTTFVQENLSAVRIVRAYVQEQAQERDFDALNRSYLASNMALARTSAVFHPTMTILAGLSLVLLVWVGGAEVIAGTVTKGRFVAFGFYLVMLAWPMIALGWVTNLFQRGAASMKRLNTVFAARPTLSTDSTDEGVSTLRGEIAFRNVSFRYPDSDRLVLDGVDFVVPAGSTVALVGPTGAGKSTIVALLAHLYEPTGGEVLIDGVPLPRLGDDRLRSALAVVPQDAFVFSETIEENIALGAVHADAAERVRTAARVAHLHETVLSFPEGYRTRVGERGVTLSGGQRQRATLARAIARDPRILVLDDALSAVDTQTETAILHQLRDVLRQRTAIVVSHRMTAVMDADQVLVIDDGRIVERGTHTELLASGGVYAELLRRQILEEDLEANADALARVSGQG